MFVEHPLLVWERLGNIRARAIRIGFGAYYTILAIRNPPKKNPSLITKALTLSASLCSWRFMGGYKCIEPFRGTLQGTP